MQSVADRERVARVLLGSCSQRGLLNDLTRGLAQQMFYWGRDVLKEGNLLLAAGFEKRVSMGLQGTSCYRLGWRGGFIELHGACAGWYPPAGGGEAPGFLFVRADRRCYAHGLEEAVVPGDYEYERLKSGHLVDVMAGARFFARWLTGYENWVCGRTGWGYREECEQLFRKLETSRNWLAPRARLEWIRAFGEGETGLGRARKRGR